jgi:hypothetical protein
MSTIAERARAEADEAERENPDAEPVEPIEPDEEEQDAEEETPAEPPSSLAEVQRQERALNAEQKRHANALQKALGEQWAQFEQCPLCQVDGYAIPYQPGEVGPEQRDAVMFVLGEGGPGHGKVHQSKVRCPSCDGYGQLYTGSRLPQTEYDACLTCNGTGTVEKSILENQAAQRERDQYTPPPPPAFDYGTPNTDKWGRVFGQQHFGEDPGLNGGVW